MDFNAVMQGISTVGFPIAMCLILVYMMYKLNEQHQEEMTKLNESLQNNTLALQHLTDIISKGTTNE